MVSCCYSQMSDTAAANGKGDDLRGCLNGLINIPFPGVIVRSQVLTGSPIHSFVFLKAFWVSRNISWSGSWINYKWGEDAAGPEAAVAKVGFSPGWGRCQSPHRKYRLIILGFLYLQLMPGKSTGLVFCFFSPMLFLVLQLFKVTMI